MWKIFQHLLLCPSHRTVRGNVVVNDAINHSRRSKLFLLLLLVNGCLGWLGVGLTAQQKENNSIYFHALPPSTGSCTAVQCEMEMKIWKIVVDDSEKAHIFRPGHVQTRTRRFWFIIGRQSGNRFNGSAILSSFPSFHSQTIYDHHAHSLADPVTHKSN